MERGVVVGEVKPSLQDSGDIAAGSLLELN